MIRQITHKGMTMPKYEMPYLGEHGFEFTVFGYWFFFWRPRPYSLHVKACKTVGSIPEDRISVRRSIR